MHQPHRENFQYTGKAVPIRPSYATAQVIDLLDEYNYQLKHDIIPNVNPFNEKLIAKSEDGRMYEIPEEIQKQAVRLWRKTNKVSKKKTSEESDEDDNNEMVDKENSAFSHIFIYVIIIGLLIVFGYFALKNIKIVKSL